MELRANEKIIKEYKKYYLIEVKCPNGTTYRTTKHKNDKNDEIKRKRITGPYNLRG